VTGPLIALAAGGTGGHMFPAEALAYALAQRHARIALITDRRGERFGGALGEAELHQVRAGQIAGRGVLGKALSALSLLWGTVQAWRLLGRIAPAAVVGFGGYASVPAVLAASWRGTPTVIHDANAVLGRANRLLAGRADRIATAFDEVRGVPAKARGKIVMTGNPVRSAIAALETAEYAPPLADGPLRLLVTGGSQGARAFSTLEAVARLPEPLRARLHVVQQVRAEDLDAVRARYAEIGVEAELAQFLDDIPARLKTAHLLICRAGASTVGELAAAGRPGLLIPYPRATDDHQAANAAAVERAGGGWRLDEHGLTPEALAGRLGALLADPEALARAASAVRRIGRTDAAARLATLVFEMIGPKANQEGL